MPTPTTTIRIDEDAKMRSKPILEELGLNLSSATNIFLKAVVRCGGLPFDLRLAARPAIAEADFVATYLAPLMSARNESLPVGYDPVTFRSRLARRNAVICQGRRTIA
ncbi:MAG: type II toxin-antitoxin system RelB/DinJ family antitoxin [Coriobacteriales bacterium]|nr:type II toxin-antitoxin system RelB/DinJ family antitoxin [Coriobacteriales bacterium]